MRKSKILMVMTALVLAVVGVLAAVTSVLSAQQQSVTSSLQVSYQANNVSATVSVASKTQSEASFGTPVSTTFNPVDSEHGLSSNIVTLAADSEAIGTFYNETTFQRYAVYKFSFTNNYTSGHGTPMSVTMNYSAPSSTTYKNNVTLLWVKSIDSTTTPSISENNNTWSLVANVKHSVISNPSTGTGVFVNAGGNNDDRVDRGETFDVYLFVIIDDVTKPSTFVLGGSSDGTLSFTLNGAA